VQICKVDVDLSRSDLAEKTYDEIAGFVALGDDQFSFQSYSMKVR